MQDFKAEYIKQLGLNVDANPIELINQMIVEHQTRFTFNNLDVLLNKLEIISLEIEDLFEKIVLKKRGGYCFEHNKLFFYMLEQLGFTVMPCLARVVYGSNKDVPQTHRMNIVTIDGLEYVADVGFGPYSPMSLIPMSGDEITAPDKQVFRVVSSEEGLFKLEVQNKKGFFALYTFTRTKSFESDFELANYYSNTHPKAKFTQKLTISLKNKGDTKFISEGVYSTISSTERSDEKLEKPQRLQELLSQNFNIEIEPDEADFIFKMFN
ncbi:MAG: arylamine N-acetyltransferase [Hyphomicrobiales bacterium]